MANVDVLMQEALPPNPELWNISLSLSNRLSWWCCRGACKIQERCESRNIQSRDLNISRHLVIRWITTYQINVIVIVTIINYNQIIQLIFLYLPGMAIKTKQSYNMAETWHKLLQLSAITQDPLIIFFRYVICWFNASNLMIMPYNLFDYISVQFKHICKCDSIITCMSLCSLYSSLFGWSYIFKNVAFYPAHSNRW